MKSKLLSILNLFSLAIHICCTYLSQYNYFSNLNVGEVSQRYNALFTPDGFTFSIWGLIYLCLSAFAIYHVYCAFRETDDHRSNIDLNAIAYLFIVNNLATALWTIVWVREQIFISVILILIQLATLIFISIRAHISNPDRPVLTKIFTQFPLNLYFGWISIAAIANISAWLKSIGWNGGGVSEAYWTIIVIGIASLLTLFMILVRRNFVFGLVVVWAFYGLVSKLNKSGAIQYENVIIATWAAIVVIAIALALRIFRKEELSDINLIQS